MVWCLSSRPVGAMPGRGTECVWSLTPSTGDGDAPCPGPFDVAPTATRGRRSVAEPPIARENHAAPRRGRVPARGEPAGAVFHPVIGAVGCPRALGLPDSLVQRPLVGGGHHPAEARHGVPDRRELLS